MNKKIIIISMISAIFLLFLYTPIFAQNYGVTMVKLGYYNPKDAKSGIIFGGMIGSAVDEAVAVGFGLDFFRGSDKKERELEGATTGGIKETGWVPDSESSVTYIPLTALVSAKIPASYQLYYTFGGGIGYGLLWANEVKYDNGEKTDSKSKFYHGFRWMLNAGILYKIGSRSAIILEAFYDQSKLSRKEDNITYKVNPSGIGVRAGIRFGLL